MKNKTINLEEENKRRKCNEPRMSYQQILAFFTTSLWKNLYFFFNIKECFHEGLKIPFLLSHHVRKDLSLSSSTSTALNPTKSTQYPRKREKKLPRVIVKFYDETFL
jgi:hypothetical protein